MKRVRKEDGLDKAIKETLLDRFQSYLDGLDESERGEEPIALDKTSEATDLFSVFVEIAATRNEVRAQSRLTKDALDQFRAVFDTLQSSHAVLEQELKGARARGRAEPGGVAANSARPYRCAGPSRRRAGVRRPGAACKLVRTLVVQGAGIGSVARGNEHDVAAA